LVRPALLSVMENLVEKYSNPFFLCLGVNYFRRQKQQVRWSRPKSRATYCDIKDLHDGKISSYDRKMVLAEVSWHLVYHWSVRFTCTIISSCLRQLRWWCEVFCLTLTLKSTVPLAYNLKYMPQDRSTNKQLNIGIWRSTISISNKISSYTVSASIHQPVLLNGFKTWALTRVLQVNVDAPHPSWNRTQYTD